MNIISLYDFTGEAVRPWAEAGAKCYCYDIQHKYWQKEHSNATVKVGKGSITFLNADLHNVDVLNDIYNEHGHERVDFLCAFPVCTDLAVSGSSHFKNKAKLNPRFQIEAAQHAINCAELAERFDCPYMIENPVSRLATLWRKPDHYFHPFQYGGYLSDAEADHPTWPDYIAPRDAYSKKTCLWVSKGEKKDTFVMPQKKPVDCQSFGSSTQHRLLGGKSMKTKNIRSATQRGFAKAVFEANYK